MATERLLVVDDDPVILGLCQSILAPQGYTIVDAKRGEEALGKLETQTFDLLLTDIRLPGLNGLEITERLRARGLELPVVTMTGYSNMEMAIQALSLGVDEFIIKPFTVDSLRITIARALEKSRLRRENARLRTLVPLLQTSQKFASTRKREQVYEHLLDAACDLLGTHTLTIFDASADAERFTVVAARGGMASLRESVLYRSQLPIAEGFLERVQLWKEQESPRFPFALPHLACMLSAPLRVRDRALGVFVAAIPRGPTPSDLEALNLMLAHAAATLENVDLLGEISRAYMNARELEQLKSEFINIAGHELRTPLAVLQGYAGLLRERSEGESRDYAQQVLVQARRLQQIADDMLNLQLLNEGPVELRLERCPIEQVVGEVVSAYQPLAMEREQSIETDVAPQAGVVKADRAMLDLMLGSLISNAIKFSPRQTRVRVLARGDADYVTLQVQDEGIGLSPDQMEHIFEPFYQASHSLTRAEGGLGVGLTLAEKMARAHGGRIWVEQERSGGSSFYITLPRENAERISE